jgi:hypothetical protein
LNIGRDGGAALALAVLDSGFSTPETEHIVRKLSWSAEESEKEHALADEQTCAKRTHFATVDPIF